jgi:AraC-like DNA-binding protein
MNWLVVVLIAGAVLGIFLAAFFLVSRTGNRRANRNLAFFVIAFALVTLSDVLDRTVELHGTGALLHLMDWMVLLLGPLLYFYVSELTGRPPFPRGALWVHGLPAALALLVYFLFYALPAEEKIAMVAAENLARRTGGPSAVALVFVLHIGSYALLCFRTLAWHTRRIRTLYSSLEDRNLRWLRVVLWLNLAVYMVWTTALLFPGELSGIIDDLAFPFSVFALGLLALRHNEEVGMALASEAGPARWLPGAGDEEPPDAKYARSGLTSAKAAALRSQLDELMDAQRPYLESDLSLPDLAGRLGVSTHHLSQLLNEDLHLTFYDYVNMKRVEEVKRMLADPAQQEYKILALAFAAGFNSKAAFNAAFKRLTGKTPREYRTALPRPAAGTR